MDEVTLKMILEELRQQRLRTERLERSVIKLVDEFKEVHSGLHTREQMILFELQEIRHTLSRIKMFDGSEDLDSPLPNGPHNKEKLRPKPLLMNLNQTISSLVIELGIPVHIKGFRFIVEALLLAAAEERVLDKPTDSLYPVIAQKYKTTPSRVERAIRHGIEVAGGRGNGAPIWDMTGMQRPTNKAFLCGVLRLLKESNEIGNWTGEVV